MFSRLKQKVKEETASDKAANVSVSDKLFTDGSAKTKSNESLMSKESLNIAMRQNENETRAEKEEDYLNERRKSEETHSKIGVKKKLSSASITSSIQNDPSTNESLNKQIELLNIELSEKLKENESMRNELNRLNQKLETFELENEIVKSDLENVHKFSLKLELEIENLKNEKDDLLIKNAELSQKYELLKLVNSREHLNAFTPKNSLSSLENVNSLISIESNPKESHLEQAVSQEQTEIRSLRDELNEKNKVIKNLQQRLNDMKKTLQKELKFQALPNESIALNIESSSKSSNLLVSSPKMDKYEWNSKIEASLSDSQQAKYSQVSKKPAGAAYSPPPPSSANLKKNPQTPNGNEDVNFKYLKHVLLKFLTCREYEALHLVKALSVLLNFSKEEEKILKETIEWKMSWFGSRPKTNLV